MEGPCTITTTLLIDITNGYKLVTVWQTQWGVIGERLMSVVVKRSAAFVGSHYEPEAGMGSYTRHSLSVSADSAESTSPSQMQG
jgi:hypothetical protein